MLHCTATQGPSNHSPHGGHTAPAHGSCCGYLLWLRSAPCWEARFLSFYTDCTWVFLTLSQKTPCPCLDDLCCPSSLQSEQEEEGIGEQAWRTVAVLLGPAGELGQPLALYLITVIGLRSTRDKDWLPVILPSLARSFLSSRQDPDACPLEHTSSVWSSVSARHAHPLPILLCFLSLY